MNPIRIVKQPNHTFYLIQQITTNDIYQRSKLITDFLEKETRKLEFVVNNEIKAILRQKGIKIPNNKESDYKKALDTLKCDFNKVIDIEDVYKGGNYENCEIIGVSENDITVVLEDNEFIQCGLQVKEIDII